MSGFVPLRTGVLVLWLALSSLSWSATGPVLVVHASTNGSLDADTLVSLTTKLTAAGYTVTASNGLPGGSLAANKQVWDIRYDNSTPLTGSDITAYVGYLSGGGSLFVMGENTGFPTRNTSIAALVSAAGGGSISAVAAAGPQTILAPFTGPNPVTSLSYLASAGLVSGATGTGASITKDSSNTSSAVVWGPGSLSNAAAGSLIVVYDVNFMETGATAASQSFLANLIAYLAAPVVVGPPGPATATGAPTLSEWAMMLLAVGLIAVASRRLMAPGHSR